MRPAFAFIMFQNGHDRGGYLGGVRGCVYFHPARGYVYGNGHVRVHGCAANRYGCVRGCGRGHAHGCAVGKWCLSP